MKTTIIIGTIQREAIVNMFASLRGQDYDELIIINDKTGKVANPRNQAMQMATGDLFVITDDDVVLAPDFMEKGKKFFEENPDVDVMQGLVVGGVISSPTNMFVTANLWIKAEVAKKFMFDTDFSSREDLDFGWRIADAGYKIGFNPMCVAYHPGKAGSTFFELDRKRLKERHPERYEKLINENNSWL